jgi:hypothetical protein
MHRREVVDAILFSLMEYFGLVVPVLLYVAIEAFHDKGAMFLLESPEWGIATGFLGVHGPAVFEEELERSGRAISPLRMRFFRGAGLMLAGGALLNSFLSFDHETLAKMVVRMMMFGLASAAFVCFAGAAHYQVLRRRPERIAQNRVDP